MTAESEHRHVLQPTRNERYTVQRRQCLYADRHLRGRSLRGCQFLSSASANAPREPLPLDLTALTDAELKLLLSLLDRASNAFTGPARVGLPAPASR